MKLTDLRKRFGRQPGQPVPDDVGHTPAPDPGLAPVVRGLGRVKLPLPATLRSGSGEEPVKALLVPYGDPMVTAQMGLTGVYSIHYPTSHPTWATLWKRDHSKLGWVPRALADRFRQLAHESEAETWEGYDAPDGREGLMVWFDAS